MLTIHSTFPPCDAQLDFEEAIQLAREIGSPASEAWVHWSLGLLLIIRGDFGHALKTIQDGLRIAFEIRHLEWMVGNQTTLGMLYLELFRPEEALQQLEQALIFARELRSQYWIYLITGSLAAAHQLLGNIGRAQTCLDTVLTPYTSMDTVNKRYCWARRADLALSQGDSAFALEISDRLIASSGGLVPESVITYLWKLKGEALAALGDQFPAVSMLQAALKNASATGERFLLWRVHVSLHNLYKMENNHSAAQEEYTAATKVIDELAFKIPDENMKDCFLQGAYKMFNK